MSSGIRTLSLFTGAGGLDLGFHSVGAKILACIDIDRASCNTLEQNKRRYFDKDCLIYNEDIIKLNPDEIPVDNVDFIIGGPPCQSFSAAGRRAGGALGTSDKRGNLFKNYCDYIEYFKPRGFLFENVRGILYSNRRDDWNQVLSEFMKRGYNLSYRVLDSADYGAPQFRERVILVGSKENEFLFPWPTHGPDSYVNKKYVTPLDAISDLQDPDEPDHVYDGKYGHLLNEIPPGMNYLYFTLEYGHPNPVFAYRSRFSHFLYKANPHWPIKTLVAKNSKFAGPFHWKNRKFTIDELKRLQTFPDDYNIYGGYNQALNQIGNSVAPKFAKILALSVVNQLFDSSFKVKLLPKSYKLGFDKRKAIRARKTRKMVRNNKLHHTQKKLDNELNTSEVISKIKYRSETKFNEYLSYNERYESFGEKKYLDSQLYKIHTIREDAVSELNVNKVGVKEVDLNSTLKLVLTFNFPIGNGFNKLSATLISDVYDDITILWDSIEDYICSNSTYLSLMDIFGHFTEPHPIFSLECLILSKDRVSFIQNFTKYFSDFSKISKIYPMSVLEDLWLRSNESCSFPGLDIVKQLRDRRFDVRVYETNKTIPKGMFKVCYPFTLQYGKQIGVSWTD